MPDEKTAATQSLLLGVINDNPDATLDEIRQAVQKEVEVRRNRGVSFVLYWPSDHDPHNPSAKLEYGLTALLGLGLVEAVRPDQAGETCYRISEAGLGLLAKMVIDAT